MANANTQFGGFLTNVGVVKQTNANALQIPWKITRMELGDAGGEPALFPDPTPSPTQTALINVVYDAPLNSLYPSPDDPGVLIAELVLPPNVGGWWIRETALRDEDGDLIAVAKPAPSYKPLLVQNTGRTQTIRMHIVVGNTANIALKIDPSVVLATRAVVEAGDAEARAYAAGLMTAHQEAADPHPQYLLRGGVTSLAASATLTAGQEGLVLIDASAGPVTVTLPAANRRIDFILRRTDNSGNRLAVQATGADRIRFHTHLRAEGYPFLVLMGAGDYWHLRSDGAGNWWPIARLDSDALGRPVFETTTLFSPGGWGALAGSIFARAEWPWLWDHALLSGMLTTEAERVGMEGGWTSGDGVMTFRGPEGRGEFLRVLDDSRGVDPSRSPGSGQAPENLAHVHDVVVAGPQVTGGAQFVPDSAKTVTYAQMLYTDEFPGDNRSVTPTDWAASGGAESRPRNIAYPGRIKLI